jgi:hypothetical protein
VEKTFSIDKDGYRRQMFHRLALIVVINMVALMSAISSDLFYLLLLILLFDLYVFRNAFKHYTNTPLIIVFQDREDTLKLIYPYQRESKVRLTEWKYYEEGDSVSRAYLKSKVSGNTIYLNCSYTNDRDLRNLLKQGQNSG